MNILGRSLVLLAVVGQIALPIADAGARPGAATGGQGPSGSAGSAGGVSGGHGSVGVGVAGGHYGGNSATGVTGGNSATGVTGGNSATGVTGGNSATGVTGGNGSTGVAGGNGGHGGNGNSAGAGSFGVAGLTGRDGFSNTNRQSPADPGFAFLSGFSAMSGGACGDLQLFDPGDFVDPIDRVAAVSQQTQSFLQFCGCNSQSCVADALDKYADALEQAAAPPPAAPSGFAPFYVPHKMPRVVRELPKIVHEAAARVRAAATPHAAAAIVREAMEKVQKKIDKTIALIRASDTDAENPATRGANLVADTLKSAAETLERADTL